MRYRIGSSGPDTRRTCRTRASTVTSRPSSFRCSGCTDSGGIEIGELMSAPSRLMLTTRAGSVNSNVAQRAPTTSSRMRERRSPSAISGSLREENQTLVFAEFRRVHLHEHPERYHRRYLGPDSERPLRRESTPGPALRRQLLSGARQCSSPARRPYPS